MREDTLAQISFYDLTGAPLGSTLAPLEDDLSLLPGQAAVVSDQETEESLIRELETPSVGYREILGIWQAREDLELGIIGAALPQTFLIRTSQITRFQILFLAAGGVVLVIGIGIYLSSRITQPLMRLVKASTEVAGGNLEARVEPGGDDEFAVLAHSFNAMVSGLREGSVYRDLLGRTVSPEVREQLRQSFATGELYLAGQETQATVLISDIRGFTPLTESQEPTTVMDWLNEYFGELVPIINSHGGVINAFEGDALLAFFGILPRPMAPEDSAYRAVRAAAGMLNIIQRLNHRRVQRGDPAFDTGIVINSGKVTAGTLGAADRLHYTVIGDTVNSTHRLQSIARTFGESGVAISGGTYEALGDRRNEFKLERLGAYTVKGKSERLVVYRLLTDNITFPVAGGPDV